MKIFISNKTLEKLQGMIKDENPGLIHIRKYNIDKDPITNVINKIKLPDKYRARHKEGHFYPYYINKRVLRNIKKQLGSESEGGILPLIPLLGLIFGGLSAAGAAAGGASAIAKAVNDKKANDEKLVEEQRHNKELESIAKGGEGIELKDSKGKYIYSNFIKSLKLDKDSRKAFKNIFEMIQEFVRMEKHGEALYLFPS